jgi:2-amino-4-hydroxy-6-hydroxymethyldihydropteridine diphosphokinase
VEDQAGRVRDGNRDSPHTLDIDLLLQGNTVLQAGRVRIPREDITRHAFVLEPLAEIAPDEVHPLRGETYASLWQQFDSSLTRQNRIGNAPV